MKGNGHIGDDLLAPDGVNNGRLNTGCQKTIVDSGFTAEVVREGDSYSAVGTKVVTQRDGAVIVRVLING